MVRLITARHALPLTFGISIFISGLTLPLLDSLAQQNDRSAAISKALLEVSDDDRHQLPEANRINPSLWNLPEYARTPTECGGDLAIGTRLVNLFKSKKRGEVVSHGGGFYSVTLPRADENTVDIMDLAPGDRDLLRGLLRAMVRNIERSEEVRTWTFRLVAIPGLVTNLWLVRIFWGADLLADKTLGDAANVAKTRLSTLADQLQAPTQLYRSVAVIKSESGSEYIRYLYAVVPNNGDPSVLRSCFFVRH
jgi:hypothetical protein